MKKWESTLYVFLGLPIWAFIYCLAVAYTSDHYKVRKLNSFLATVRKFKFSATQIYVKSNLVNSES